jgi:hypothetical protein
VKWFLAALAASALALGSSSTARADADFADSAGDGSGAPDLSKVSVMNDSFGKISFVLALADGKDLQADGEITVVIDSDRDPETGDDGGWDYLLIANGADRSWSLAHWEGEDFNWDARSSTAQVRLIEGFAVLSINRSDLGNSGAFDFFISSAKLDGNEAVASDAAPEGSDYWSYSLVEKRLSLVTGPVARVPKTAKAGKSYGVGFVVARSDSPEAITEAAVKCRARVGGKVVAAKGLFVRPAGQITDGVATCQLKLPKTAKGKTVQLKVTVTFNGVSSTRTSSTRIR